MAVREPDIVDDELAHEVIGAAIEVHRVLGPGYLESVYQEAMRIELGLQEIPFVDQPGISVEYKGNRIAQVISYLKVTGNVRGLLINFNTDVLKSRVKRVVRTI